MSKTFAEVQTNLKTLQYRRTLLMHVLNHLESMFLPKDGSVAENMLLTDDKTPIPETVIDSYVTELLSDVKDIETAISDIMSTEVEK